MANKDTKNSHMPAPPKNVGPGMSGSGSRNGAGITRSKSGGVYNTGNWLTNMGAQNTSVANNGRTANPNKATGSTRTSPEVSLEYTDSKSINRTLSANSGDPRTNVAGNKRVKGSGY